MVVRLVWDQEVAGSNPVSPTFINTGTMKKFSQYINSHEDCDCNQVQEELTFGMPINKGGFLKGAAVALAKKVAGGAANSLLGAGAADVVAGGKGGDLETSKVVDAKLNCRERSLALKRQLTSAMRTSNLAQDRAKRTGSADDADDATRYAEIVNDLKDEIDHHEAECNKIQSSRTMHDVEKAKLSGSRERLAKLSGTP